MNNNAPHHKETKKPTTTTTNLIQLNPRFLLPPLPPSQKKNPTPSYSQTSKQFENLWSKFPLTCPNLIRFCTVIIDLAEAEIFGHQYIIKWNEDDSSFLPSFLSSFLPSFLPLMFTFLQKRRGKPTRIGKFPKQNSTNTNKSQKTELALKVITIIIIIL